MAANRTISYGSGGTNGRRLISIASSPICPRLSMAGSEFVIGQMSTAIELLGRGKNASDGM